MKINLLTKMKENPYQPLFKYSFKKKKCAALIFAVPCQSDPIFFGFSLSLSPPLLHHSNLIPLINFWHHFNCNKCIYEYNHFFVIQPKLLTDSAPRIQIVCNHK